MAHALQIDTLAFSKRLKEAGADDGLAEAIVEGITAADTSELATQADLAEVKYELKADIAQTGNRTVVILGSFIGVLFAIDKLFPLLGLQ